MKLLVLCSGIPGTGKTLAADHAARLLSATLLSKDIVEAALRRSGIGADGNSGWAAYEVLTSVAEEQLRLGRSVVLDSVAGTASIRATWRDLALRHGAALRVIECICIDESLHRDRIQGRERGIPGWPELSWAEVERVRGSFEPWRDERLVLDAARPLLENLEAVREYLAGPPDHRAN